MKTLTKATYRSQTVLGIFSLELCGQEPGEGKKFKWTKKRHKNNDT